MPMFDLPGLQNLEAPLEAIAGAAQSAWGGGADGLPGAMARGLIEPNVLDFSSDIYRSTVDGLLKSGHMPDQDECKKFLQACMQFGGPLGMQLGQRFLAYLGQQFDAMNGADPDDPSGGAYGGEADEAGGEAGGGGGSGGGGYEGGGGGGDGGYDGGGGGGGGGSSYDGGAGARAHAPDMWDGDLGGGLAEQIVRSANSQVGDRLWAETEFAGACEGGNVGCAASVTKVLRDCGVNFADSASVVELSKQLRAGGWQDAGGAEAAQPGDVIYGDGGGDHQHIGIVGLDSSGHLTVYNNWSSDGAWHNEPINQCSILTSFGANQIHVLRAPNAKAHQYPPSTHPDKGGQTAAASHSTHPNSSR